MHKVRRINIFGGPGCGKSTSAACLFKDLKCNAYNVELVQEYVKTWAYEGRDVKPFDQLYLFSKQLRKEAVLLYDSRVDLLVTDSPLLLSVCYATMHNPSLVPHLRGLADEFEKSYKSFNIVLDRHNCSYRPDGRYQDYDAAVEMDRLIRHQLSANNIDFTEVPYHEHDEIARTVEEVLDNDG